MNEQFQEDSSTSEQQVDVTIKSSLSTSSSINEDSTSSSATSVVDQDSIKFVITLSEKEWQQIKRIIRL